MEKENSNEGNETDLSQGGVKRKKVRQSSDDSNISENSEIVLRNVKQRQSYRELTSESDSELEEDRFRTPSGTIFPPSGDIRSFFETKQRSDLAVKVSEKNSQCQSTVLVNEPKPQRFKGQPKKKKINIDNNQPSVKDVVEKQKHQSADQLSAKENMSEEENRQKDCENNIQGDKDKESEDAFLYELANQMGTIPDSDNNIESDEPTSEMETVDDTSGNEMHSATSKKTQVFKQSFDRVASKLKGSIDKLTTMSEGEDIPQVMNVATVLQMFKEIKDEIVKAAASLDQNLIGENKPAVDVAALKQECVQTIQQSVNQTVQLEVDKIKQAERMGSEAKRKNQVLTQVCNRMDSELKDLEQRIEHLEVNNSKRMVIITGLESDHVSRKEMVAYLDLFFMENLTIDVHVDDYFTLGQKSPKPIVVILPTIQAKKQIMREKKRLQQFDQGKKIYINDYTPAMVQDRRKREREIKNTAQEKYGEESVTYSRSGLTIKGIPYRKMVTPPLLLR